MALGAAYALAATLLLMGLLGFFIWDALDDAVGVGATILGILVLAATYLAWRGSRPGRARDVLCGRAAQEDHHRADAFHGDKPSGRLARRQIVARRLVDAAAFAAAIAAIFCVMAGVGSVPGHSALQVIPLVVVSIATARVMPTMAVLVVT